MRITVRTFARVGNAHLFQHFDGVRARLLSGMAEMSLRDFHQLFRDAHERIERSHRILKDHGDLLPANVPHFARRKLQHIPPAEKNLARNDLSRRLGD